MSETCPKCGAKRERRGLYHRYYKCDSYINQCGEMLKDGHSCLTRQLAAMTAERDALAGELDRLHRAEMQSFADEYLKETTPRPAAPPTHWATAPKMLARIAELESQLAESRREGERLTEALKNLAASFAYQAKTAHDRGEQAAYEDACQTVFDVMSPETTPATQAQE